MKKLTAGIFATLLAVVSVGAAHAEIASKGYVDQQVGTKADASTVTSLQGTVSGHTTQIGTINEKIGGYGDIVTHDVDEFATAAQGAKADTAVQPAAIQDMQVKANLTTTLSGTSTDAQYPSAKAVWDTIQTETTGIASSSDLSALTTRVTTAEGEIDTLQTDMAGKANTADLGTLATKSSVATADIASKAVTKEKLADDIVTSLGKADTALQQADLDGYLTKTAADAAYADIATETTASTASTNAQAALKNIGTLTDLTTEAKTNTVAAINEVATEAADAASAASAADTKAGQAQTAATKAQGEVDALEGVVNNAETGLAATNTIADNALSTAKSAQTTANAALPKATYDGQVGTVSATNMGTSASTVVAAIKEVAGEASTAQSTANAAIPKPDGECASGTAKCVLTFNNSAYAWEVIARNGEGE